MGWLWSSSSSSSRTEAPKQPSSQSQSVGNRPPPPTSSSSSSSSAPNEPVDPEIQKFFDLFHNDKNANPGSSSSSPEQQQQQQQGQSSQSSNESSSSSSSSSQSSWLSSLRPSKPTSTTQEPAPPGDPLSEALLPTDMSCRQAFDLAWACNSMGGQWNAVYRYGSMRSCSEQWDGFWFCMRTKSYAGEMRENMIRAHYRNKEHAKYGPGKPSSEDVWESRREKVAPGSVFTEKIE